jgi:SAM-dependent methyltransferase
MGRRSIIRKIIDFLTFPARSVTLFYDDKLGLSSLSTERFDYIANEVKGYCLDVGCGRHNRFVREFLHGNGRGIDVFPYEGLTEEEIVEDITHFPFPDSTFDTVTFIANINHVPKQDRDIELKEAYRVLRQKGRIVVSMGNPFAEVLVHKLVRIYDKLLKTTYDVDSERGMGEGEEYYLTDHEIVERLIRAGFRRVQKKHFITQWRLNHLIVAWKD